ncbi:MAG: CRISPR-associated endonuclease Cas1 [Thermoprotei archaeon]|nr:MAG: CRISPR-associated endonuclease Cas1 [Thermoprotei archaeon]
MTTIIIKDYGVKLSYRRGMVVITKRGQVLDKVPLTTIEQIIVVTSGVALTSKLLRHCARNHIDIVVLDHRGEPIARLYPVTIGGTVLYRRAQYEAYNDHRGPHIARAIVMTKLRNQSNFLRYLAKNRKKTDPTTAEQLTDAAAKIIELTQQLIKVDNDKLSDDLRQKLLTIEGHGARVYWEALAQALPTYLHFPGRDQEGQDIVNRSLNYLYGVLKSVTWKATTLAGLDPYAGYLHIDRSGRPSLTLDLMEPLRPALVDRVIVSYVQRKQLKIHEVMEDGGRLSPWYRTELIKALQERLQTRTTYLGKSVTREQVPYLQARNLARYLIGREPQYIPFEEKYWY